MAEYKSDNKTIPHPSSEVFVVLSDLNNLELAKDRIPQDKIKDLSFDQDSCTISVDPIGNIKFIIIERVSNQLIKFKADKIPFDLVLEVKLEEANSDECNMQIIVNAELNPFLKPMISKPLQQGIDKIAELLAQLPYDKIKN